MAYLIVFFSISHLLSILLFCQFSAILPYNFLTFSLCLLSFSSFLSFTTLNLFCFSCLFPCRHFASLAVYITLISTWSKSQSVALQLCTSITAVTCLTSIRYWSIWFLVTPFDEYPIAFLISYLGNWQLLMAILYLKPNLKVFSLVLSCRLSLPTTSQYICVFNFSIELSQNYLNIMPSLFLLYVSARDS